VLLDFLLDVVVGGEPGSRRRDQAAQRNSTQSHFEEFGENLEEEEEEEEDVRWISAVLRFGFWKINRIKKIKMFRVFTVFVKTVTAVISLSCITIA